MLPFASGAIELAQRGRSGGSQVKTLSLFTDRRTEQSPPAFVVGSMVFAILLNHPDAFREPAIDKRAGTGSRGQPKGHSVERAPFNEV